MNIWKSIELSLIMRRGHAWEQVDHKQEFKLIKPPSSTDMYTRLNFERNRIHSNEKESAPLNPLNNQDSSTNS